MRRVAAASWPHGSRGLGFRVQGVRMWGVGPVEALETVGFRASTLMSVCLSQIKLHVNLTPHGIAAGNCDNGAS